MSICIQPHPGELSLAKRFVRRAEQIHRSLHVGCNLQVRWHSGRLLTYRYPAPRGYGVRGVLVAIYTAGAAREWIEEDLLTFAVTLCDTRAPASP